MFIITKQSGVNPNRTCIIGSGETKSQAWEDAYGPKPWTGYNKKSARDACCEEVTEEQYFEMINHE